MTQMAQDREGTSKGLEQEEQGGGGKCASSPCTPFCTVGGMGHEHAPTTCVVPKLCTKCTQISLTKKLFSILN